MPTPCQPSGTDSQPLSPQTCSPRAETDWRTPGAHAEHGHRGVSVLGVHRAGQAWGVCGRFLAPALLVSKFRSVAFGVFISPPQYKRTPGQALSSSPPRHMAQPARALDLHVCGHKGPALSAVFQKHKQTPVDRDMLWERHRVGWEHSLPVSECRGPACHTALSRDPGRQ